MYSTTSIKNISAVFEHEYDQSESKAERKWCQRFAKETDIISRVVARERQLRRPLTFRDLENRLFSRSELDSISDILHWLIQTKEEENHQGDPV